MGILVASPTISTLWICSFLRPISLCNGKDTAAASVYLKDLQFYEDKVNLNTFIAITLSELPRQFQLVDDSMDCLMKFADPGSTGKLSSAQLRHLLTDVCTSNRLSQNDFIKFQRLIGGADVQIKYGELTETLLIGQSWKNML